MTICPKCKKPMQALVTQAKPDSSEWYCEKDHVSILFSKDDLEEHGFSIGEPLVAEPHRARRR